MPNIPYRSRLRPHWEAIKRLRSEKQTWVEIAQHLTEKCDCPTSFQAVHSFYKRRIKGRVPLGFDEPQTVLPNPSAQASQLSPKPSADAPAPDATGFFEPATVRPAGGKKPKKFNLGY